MLAETLLVRFYDAAFYEDYITYGECPGYGQTVEKMKESIRKTSKLLISCNTACRVLTDNVRSGNYKIYGMQQGGTLPLSEEAMTKLIDGCSTAIISSVDSDGYPNTKAMLAPRKRVGLSEIYRFQGQNISCI